MNGLTPGLSHEQFGKVAPDAALEAARAIDASKDIFIFRQIWPGGLAAVPLVLSKRRAKQVFSVSGNAVFFLDTRCLQCNNPWAIDLLEGLGSRL
jgi:hypothetical protein